MKNSRRAFFVQGGAVLGAAAAATASASANRQPADDREMIRQLHLSYMALMEDQRYAAVAGLFVGEAANVLPVTHSAYRPNASQLKDVLTMSTDRMQATAVHHVDVKVSTPLLDDCTAAQMARLQGQVADCRWESGRLEAKYVKTRGKWKIASLTYSPA